ncbi:MAG: hypothetical protein HY038_13915 [Nitrospirae bacterium]|nr:hypothetical protein [Nitrospirota bacterium]
MNTVRIRARNADSESIEDLERQVRLRQPPPVSSVEIRLPKTEEAKKKSIAVKID